MNSDKLKLRTKNFEIRIIKLIENLKESELMKEERPAESVKEVNELTAIFKSLGKTFEYKLKNSKSGIPYFKLKNA
jgi:hypothetical protein